MYTLKKYGKRADHWSEGGSGIKKKEKLEDAEKTPSQPCLTFSRGQSMARDEIRTISEKVRSARIDSLL